jgi:hypothetical protein
MQENLVRDTLNLAPNEEPAGPAPASDPALDLMRTHCRDDPSRDVLYKKNRADCCVWLGIKCGQQLFAVSGLYCGCLCVRRGERPLARRVAESQTQRTVRVVSRNLMTRQFGRSTA